MKPLRIRASQRYEKSQILDTQVALLAFEISEIAAQLTKDLSQDTLLAALCKLFLLTAESFRFALDIWIVGFERDLTELRSVEV